MTATMRRAGSILASAVAGAAFVCCPARPAPIASAAVGRTVAARVVAAIHLAVLDKQAEATCDPSVSLTPPPGPPKVTAGSYMEKIRARGYLIAGVDLNDYHLGYFNPSDRQVEGFDIDMVRAIATAIFGRPNIQFVGLTDTQREPFVRSGRVDIVAHTMTITCHRLLGEDFSTVYFEAHQQILVEEGSRISGVNDLVGRKVCATKSSTSLDYLQKQGAIPVKAYDWSDCLVLLQQGQVAAISTDNVILEELHAQDPYTKIVGPLLTDEPYGLAISKDHPDFVRFVNAVLAQMRADGQWAASYRRWIGSPAPAPPAAHYKG